MPDFNRTIINGRICSVPRYFRTNEGTAGVEFTLVSGKKFETKAGKAVDDTLYLDCKVFGKKAETISRYLGKGTVMLACGRLRMDKWFGELERKFSKIKMVLEDFEVIKTVSPETTAAMPELDQPPPRDSSEFE